jgi:radical SAM superfamily enzyme YgiQ (UPF0313 family)
MNILLVYPEYPDTFWGCKSIMKIVGKKAAFPPLGLLTVAAMLPSSCDKRLIDMNVSELKDEDILWADYVFISAMIAQKESVKEVIGLCNNLKVKVVAGGPLFTTGHEEFEGVYSFVVGEAEETFPVFWNDLTNGRAKNLYISSTHPSVSKAPTPLWGLINPKDYVALSAQISRGCPFNCEFCDIIVMNGRIPRVKGASQVLQELSVIFETGFRGRILIVDDNFIGNKGKVREILLDILDWQQKNGFPFSFSTEASINLADDESLMTLMVQAGFEIVFLGLETPSSIGLAECGKVQNNNRDLVESVKKIQRHGLQTFGGFIVGFDSDPVTIFDDQLKFIQEAGVVVAMLGLLQALPKTRLYERLLREGRILNQSSGNNTDCFTNFTPVMDKDILFAGYKKTVGEIYSPRKYYERMCTFLDEFKPCRKISGRLNRDGLKAFAFSIWYIGITGRWKDKWYYWKMLAIALFKYRPAFTEVVAMLIYGSHLRGIAENIKKS